MSLIQKILPSFRLKHVADTVSSTGLHQLHCVFLQWLLFAWFLLYCLYIASQYDFFSLLLARDPTYISSLILILFLLTSGYFGYRNKLLSDEINLGLTLIANLHDQCRLTFSERTKPIGLIAEYYLDTVRDQEKRPQTVATAAVEHAIWSNLLEQKVSDHHEIGWFSVNLLLKLGLLGTVVGFILMINALTEVKTIEYSDLKGLISNMALGMGIALTTTVVGLVTSILLGIQCLLLDRAASLVMALALQTQLTTDSKVSHTGSAHAY